MARTIRIYQTPGLLRAIGLFFLITGLFTVAVIVMRIARGELPIGDTAVGLVVGNVFTIVGWAVFASDSITYCEHSREIVFISRHSAQKKHIALS